MLGVRGYALTANAHARPDTHANTRESFGYPLAWVLDAYAIGGILDTEGRGKTATDESCEVVGRHPF